MSASDYESLKAAIRQAEEETLILMHTRDYKILKQLESKVATWLEQADAATDNPEGVEQLERL